MRADRTSDIPVAPLALSLALARPGSREGRLGRTRPVRVNERADERPGMPSVWRRPLPRNALSGARLGPSPAPRLGHRSAGCRRFCTPSSLLAETVRAGFLSTRSVANGRRASLNLDVVRRLLQPITTRGHTREPSILAREWGFRPATRRHQPMPVALARAMRCRTVGLASRVLRAPAFRTSRSACAEEAGHGPGHSSEGEPRALDDVARALLVASRAPGSPVRFFAGSGRPGVPSHRPRTSLDAFPRRTAPSKSSRCLWKRRNPYATRGLLPGARPDRGPFTLPPWRLCSGAARLFNRPLFGALI